MGIFVCPGCRQIRNDFDKMANGRCRNCAGGARSAVSKKSQQVAKLLPCAECGKFIGPNQGKMMKSNNNIVFCYECLNSGKWLNYFRKQGVKTVTEDHEKRGAKFGRG